MMGVEYLFNHTTITIALGAAILGAVSGALGSFAVLRQQSLVGDALSHAALPGIVAGFILTGSKSPLVLMAGAAVAGLVGMLLVMLVSATSRVKFDSALAIVLSVFFGFGLVLLTWIQKNPTASQAGLDRFLFGQAAALLRRDVWVLGWIALVSLVLVVLAWKEFKILSFDPDFGRSLGIPMRGVDVFLTGLITVAIVMGLQTVGVVLMSAMIVAPGAAARQWTDRLGPMVILAGCIGAFAGVAGAIASSSVERMPTGPAIVLAVGVVVVISLAFAPGRGLVAESIRRRKNRKRLRLDVVLMDLYELESQHTEGSPYGHSVKAIQAMSFGEGPVMPTLLELEKNHMAARLADDLWTITPKGTRRVKKLIRLFNQQAEGLSR